MQPIPVKMLKRLCLVSCLFAGACWGASAPPTTMPAAPQPIPVPEKVNCDEVLASDELVPLQPQGWSVRARSRHLFYLVSYDQYLAVLKACQPR